MAIEAAFDEVEQAPAQPLPHWRAFMGPPADAVWRFLHRRRQPMRCALLHAVAIWFWHAAGPYIAAVLNPACWKLRRVDQHFKLTMTASNMVRMARMLGRSPIGTLR